MPIIGKGEQSATVWVCSDCMMLLANGERSEDSDREPLGEIPDFVSIVPGIGWEDHADDCPNRAADSWVDECSCERDDFSSSRCYGCGSTLAGERCGATVFWLPEISTGDTVTGLDAQGQTVTGSYVGSDGYADALIVRTDGVPVRVHLDSVSRAA